MYFSFFLPPGVSKTKPIYQQPQIRNYSDLYTQVSLLLSKQVIKLGFNVGQYIKFTLL